MPETTVIMTSYNHAPYIGSAIESVIRQTYTDWQLVIVDDGSSDGSCEIIKSYAAKYPQSIRFITHQKGQNLGIKATYESAFSHITGEYAAFLESDDEWFPNCLEKKIDLLKNNKELSLIFSNIVLTGNEKSAAHLDYIKYCRFSGRMINKFPGMAEKIITYRNPAAGFSNMVVPVSVLKDFYIIKDYEIWADWQLLLEGAERGRVGFLDEKLVKWRIHAKNTNLGFEKNKNVFSLQKSFIRDIFRTKNYKRLSQPAAIEKLKYDIRFGMRYPSSAFRKLLK